MLFQWPLLFLHLPWPSLSLPRRNPTSSSLKLSPEMMIRRTWSVFSNQCVRARKSVTHCSGRSANSSSPLSTVSRHHQLLMMSPPRLLRPVKLLKLTRRRHRRKIFQRSSLCFTKRHSGSTALPNVWKISSLIRDPSVEIDHQIRCTTKAKATGIIKTSTIQMVAVETAGFSLKILWRRKSALKPNKIKLMRKRPKITTRMCVFG